MSDSDEYDDCYGDESVQATRIRHYLEYENEQLRKELLNERERANKFDRLLKAVYDVLFNSDSVIYHKIMRLFEGQAD